MLIFSFNDLMRFMMSNNKNQPMDFEKKIAEIEDRIKSVTALAKIMIWILIRS